MKKLITEIGLVVTTLVVVIVYGVVVILGDTKTLEDVIWYLLLSSAVLALSVVCSMVLSKFIK